MVSFKWLENELNETIDSPRTKLCNEFCNGSCNYKIRDMRLDKVCSLFKKDSNWSIQRGISRSVFAVSCSESNHFDPDRDKIIAFTLSDF